MPGFKNGTKEDFAAIMEGAVAFPAKQGLAPPVERLKGEHTFSRRRDTTHLATVAADRELLD